MAKYSFSQLERFSIWLAHKETCYYCREFLPFSSLNIDHIIPETILNDNKKLEECKHKFDLTDDFRINSYYNWLPACRKCNLNKKDFLLNPQLAVIPLTSAREIYEKIKEIETKLDNTKSLDKLASYLQLCLEKGLISRGNISDLFLYVGNDAADKLISMVNIFCSLIERGHYQDAIFYIKKCMKLFPKDETGFMYHALGFCYLQLKEYQLAILNCTKAINKNPHLSLAYFNRGQAYFLPYYEYFYGSDESADLLLRITSFRDDVIAFEQFNLAMKDYDSAIKIDPNYPGSFYWRSICRMFLKTRFKYHFF